MMQNEAVAEWREAYREASQAPTWLEAHRWTYGPHVARCTVMDVRAKLELDPEDKVLEVGAGSGGFLMELLHENQRGIGLDLCESLVQERGRFGIDSDRIKLGVAEGAHLPIASESFDKVLCYSVAHHFPDGVYARNVIHELVRVCRSGGIVLLGDVCGVMERHRRNWIKRGVPPLLVDGLLLAVSPVRYVRWMRKRRKSSRWGRSYRRRFFERALRSLPCECEILEQDIPDRQESLGRFDVRIWKKRTMSRASGCAALMFWSSVEVVQGLILECAILLHG